MLEVEFGHLWRFWRLWEVAKRVLVDLKTSADQEIGPKLDSEAVKPGLSDGGKEEGV